MHDLLHILLIARMHYHVGHLTDNTLTKFDNLLRGFSRGVFNAGIVVQENVSLAHDGYERLNLSGLKRRRAIQDYRGIALILLF